MSAVDSWFFYLINRRCANFFYDLVMPYITLIGSGEAVFIIALALIVFGRRNKKALTAGILLIAGLTVEYYAVGFLKHWIARPRPFMVLPDVRVFMRDGGFSFPSGHSAATFMAASVLSGFFKRAPLYFTIAFIVGFSRVYLGVHYVSDVLAGALMGMAIGYGLLAVSKRLIE